MPTFDELTVAYTYKNRSREIPGSVFGIWVFLFWEAESYRPYSSLNLFFRYSV